MGAENADQRSPDACGEFLHGGAVGAGGAASVLRRAQNLAPAADLRSEPQERRAEHPGGAHRYAHRRTPRRRRPLACAGRPGLRPIAALQPPRASASPGSSRTTPRPFPARPAPRAGSRERAKSKSAIGRADALRLSMRTLLTRGPLAQAHPEQWAPFVVVGEGNAPVQVAHLKSLPSLAPNQKALGHSQKRSAPAPKWQDTIWER